MKSNLKKGYKKIPDSGSTNKTEEDFINQAERDTEKAEKKNISSFLIRIPLDLKKKLKKYSYENDYNMNQICIAAITQFLEKEKQEDA